MTTVQNIIKQKAIDNGDATYLRYKDKTITYKELDKKTNAIANELLSRDIRPGDHVVIFMYNKPEYVLAYLALAKIGVIVVPVDTRFTDTTLTYILSKTEASTIILDSETREMYESVRENATSISTEYYVNPESVSNPYSAFKQLLEGETTDPQVSVSKTDTVSISFIEKQKRDRPQGIMLPQYSYVSTGWETSQNLFDFSASDCIFTNLPLYSIFTFQVGAIGALISNAQFVIEEPFDPDLFWEQIEAYTPTILLYLGRTLPVLYNREREAESDDNPLEKAIGHGFGFGFATDKQRIKDFEKKFDVDIYEGYGSTETAAIATYNSPQDCRIGTNGKPISYADVAIVDSDDCFVDPGETGEIVVRPSRQHTMIQRYYDEPEATVNIFQNQWIHTGGVGYIDNEGYLNFVAHKSNSIYRDQITGRISSLEIESVINSHEHIDESAVIGVENNTGREEIYAAVVPTGNIRIDPVDICRHCEKTLSRIKVPRYIDIYDELPRTPSGKIDKQSLQKKSPSDAWDRETGYEFTR
jgi:acyl-CoA synthetase (AMP-forming)/AMP-acid ligase II